MPDVDVDIDVVLVVFATTMRLVDAIRFASAAARFSRCAVAAACSCRSLRSRALRTFGMTVSLAAAAWASTDGGAAWLPVEEDAPPALRVFGREGGEEGVNFSPNTFKPGLYELFLRQVRRSIK